MFSIHTLVPSPSYTSIETSGLNINLGAPINGPPIDDGVSIEGCFIYITDNLGGINNMSGGLRLKDCSLLGFQGVGLGSNGIIPSLGINQFDGYNELEDSIIAGFDEGVYDSPAGLAKLRRNLFWKNRNGAHVRGLPNLGDDFTSENKFFKNTNKNLVCTPDGLTIPISAKGNWWYNSSGQLCADGAAILLTMEGVTEFASKSGEREISIDDFKTDDILDDGMPISGRNGMISLAGLVGAAGAYVIGRNRGREGYNSK